MVLINLKKPVVIKLSFFVMNLQFLATFNPAIYVATRHSDFYEKRTSAKQEETNCCVQPVLQ